ncbi:MAG: ABC transporter substrate-binding protein [Rhodobacterales bacterium]|nr:ABC transporter substrate-binding protein [Rhodobacterales bacterium]
MTRPATLFLLTTALASPVSAETFDEAALLAAALTEPPLMVIDSTGKVREQVAGFTAKYGLEANGTKSEAPGTIRMVMSEAQAGNVQADVLVISDTPAAMAQLIQPGIAISYLPSDMVDAIPEAARDPLVVSYSPIVWSFNTALHESCPVNNIWALTDPEWAGRVALPDPLGKPAYTDWFNQFAAHHDAAFAEAYEAHYGKPLATDLASAAEAWVTALAANQPLLVESDSDTAEAVGAPDATETFIGILSTAKFRDNDDGMKLGICAGMEPFVGLMTPKFALITTGSDSPNAARLFVHYLLTEEGWAPQAIDGKMATNITHAPVEDEPSGVAALMDKIWVYDTTTSSEDWNTRQDWQDVWSLARVGQ